jgi:hypothetical protein
MATNVFGWRRVPVVTFTYLLALLGGCGGESAFMARSANAPIQCVVSREECTSEVLPEGASEIQCNAFSSVARMVSATICGPNTNDSTTLSNACFDQLCRKAKGNPLVPYEYPSDCAVMSAGLADSGTVPNTGACQVVPAGEALATVGFKQHSSQCTAQPGGVCDPLTLSEPLSAVPPGNCYDLTAVPAQTQLQPPSTDHDRALQITNLVRSDSRCNQAFAFAGAYALGTGVFAQAVGGGVSVPISATRSSVVLSRPCATCAFNRLEKLRIDVGDLTVSGAHITQAYVAAQTGTGLQIPDPDDPTRTGVAARQLSLNVVGLLNGVPTIYRATNDQAMSIVATATSFHLSGTLNILDVDASGSPLPVTVTVDAQGAPATQQQAACNGLSPRARLFGFEDPMQWTTSSATLSLVTSPVTQGCGALGIAGSGYIPITGAAFTAGGLSLSPALSVDLFIPNNQPNQFYLGALQMYLSCPSVGSNNQYIGQVELTGKPQNQYSTLRFPLPAAVTQTLQRAPDDCFWSFALNVNNTGKTWSLDNLRFTP